MSSTRYMQHGCSLALTNPRTCYAAYGGRWRCDVCGRNQAASAPYPLHCTRGGEWDLCAECATPQKHARHDQPLLLCRSSRTQHCAECGLPGDEADAGTLHYRCVACPAFAICEYCFCSSQRPRYQRQFANIETTAAAVGQCQCLACKIMTNLY